MFCGRLGENKVLVFTVVKRLAVEMRKYREEQKSVNESEEHAGFRQMVNIVFAHSVNNSSCRH